jgi:DNA-binding transcriptional ArsR family regulator
VHPERRPATPDEAKALGHPLRLRILRLCLDEELTNAEISERLGKDPGTVLHHVRLLVDNGFLAAGEVRRGRRGSRERPYRATRRSWVLDFSQQPGAAAVEVAVAEAFAAELRETPPEDVLTSARLGVRLRPEDRDELVARLDDLVHEIDRREDPEGEPLGFYIAAHKRQLHRARGTDDE